MVYRRRPPELADKRPVLDAMGRCKKVLNTEIGKIKYGSPDFVEIHKVTKAIDALATHLTGDDTFYHTGSHMPGSPPSTRWQDSGS